MSPIQLTVLAGILILITMINLKIAIWYIDRKQAKRALQNYSNQEQSENTVQQVHVPFTLNEIKCGDSISNNIDQYLDALKTKEMWLYRRTWTPKAETLGHFGKGYF